MSQIKRRAITVISAGIFIVAMIMSFMLTPALADSGTSGQTGTRKNFAEVFYSEGYIHEGKFNNFKKTFIVDVSQYQTNVDFNKVYAAGIDGVILRIGYRGYKYGGFSADTSFDKYYTQAKAAGLKVGAYFFGQPDSLSDSTDETNYILALLKGRALDMPLVYDLEYATNDSGITGRLYEAKFTKAQLTSIVNNFCSIVRKKGYEPMLYTGCSMLTTKMNGADLTCSVWIARYNEFVDYICNYTMWQYTHTGKVDGISGNCDVSVLYSEYDTGSGGVDPSSVPSESSSSTVPSSNPVTQPSTQPTSKPTTQPSTNPVTQPTTQPTTQPSVPVTEPTTVPSTETPVTQDSIPFIQLILDLLLKAVALISAFIPKIAEIIAAAT